MPTYHRSQRLRLVGTGPKVEQLQEGRFRLTFTCTATNPNEAWMNGNKDQIMTTYGTLQSAQKNIAGIDPRTDEAYSDMVLFRTEANPSERDLIITLVYETATTSFVKSQDDKIDFELNGLQRVTRVTIAKTGTTLPSVTVGETLIGVNGISCKLASRSVEENDAFIQITETYLQSGITDVREDIIGSQKSIVITKVGNVPTASEAASKSDIAYDASDDWSVARKDVAQEGGLKIYTYTFLLDNTVLSQSQDKKGSLKTEVIEVYNPKVTIDGLAVDGGSSVAGNYFLSLTALNGKNFYQQSQGDFYPKNISYTGSEWRLGQYTGVYAVSTDTNPDNPLDPPSTGWNGTGNNEVTNITIREFDQTLPSSTSGFELSHRYDKEGYSLIGLQQSNIDGIPTMRYTFAKDNSIVSVTEDKVGSRTAIVNEVFNPASESITGVDTDNVALSGYVEADRTESDYEGIKTIRVRFLKNNVTLSTSEDKVGSQLAIVKEVFNGTPATPSGYSIADESISNIDGIPTRRFRFLKNNVTLSTSEDKIGSQLAVVKEVFNGTPSTPSGYSIADEQISSVDGIPTRRFRFLKNNVTLSTSEDKVGSQLAIVKEVFNGTPITPTGYSIADESISNVGGIATKRFRFLKNDAQLSLSVDKQSSLETEIQEWFNPESDSDRDSKTGYSLINEQQSNVQGIPTTRYTFAKNNVTLSTSEDKIGSQLAIVKEVFNGTPSTPSGYSIAKEDVSSVDGIPTKRFTFLKPSILSRTDDKQNPACPITIVAFDKDETDSGIFASTGAEVDSDIYVLVSKTERDFEGIETFEMRFEKKVYLLSEKENEFGRIENVLVEQGATNYALQTMPGTAVTVNDSANSYIIAQEITEGIVKKRTTTYSTAGIESASEDLVGSTKVITITSFITAPTTANAATYSNDGSDSASDFVLISDTNNRIFGVDLYTYKFARKNAIVSTSYDLVGSQKAFVVEKFGNSAGDSAPATSETINTVDLSSYSLARKDESNVDGIKTFRYTFLKPGILSVSQDFTLDVNQITVQAFSRTEAQVKTALSEVTTDHKLIRQSEQNHDGITTTSYVFEINTSDIINFTADDRLQVTRTIYEVHNYDYNANYTVNASTATVNNTPVTLTSLRVDQRGTSGTFTKLTAVYTQPKIISASPVARNQYNLTPLYQYRSLSATPKTIDTAAALATPNGGTIGANAVFLEPDVSNTSSPPVITQNVLDTSVDLSVSGSSALISSNQDLYNFLYPGVVRLDSRFFGRFLNSPSDSTLRFNRIDISTNKEAQPVTTKIRCQVYNFIQRSDQIADTDFTYDGASGLWSPNSWATVDAKIIKNYFGTAQEPSQLNNVYTGYRINGSSIRGNLTQIFNGTNALNAVVVYNGVNYGYDAQGYFYEIKITEPGPPDPIGKKWCLGVDIQPAFRDSSNNTYYNKQIIVTETIPSLQRGQITYT